MFVLEVQDWNSQVIEANLDDILYYVVLNWNDTGGYWTIGIRNSALQLITSGVSLVPNFPITFQFRYADMPSGEIWVVTDGYTSGPIPRDGFSSGRYQLIYQTQQDLLEEGYLNFWGRTSPNVV